MHQTSGNGSSHSHELLVGGADASSMTGSVDEELSKRANRLASKGSETKNKRQATMDNLKLTSSPPASREPEDLRQGEQQPAAPPRTGVSPVPSSAAAAAGGADVMAMLSRIDASLTQLCADQAAISARVGSVESRLAGQRGEDYDPASHRADYFDPASPLKQQVRASVSRLHSLPIAHTLGVLQVFPILAQLHKHRSLHVKAAWRPAETGVENDSGDMGSRANKKEDLKVMVGDRSP